MQLLLDILSCPDKVRTLSLKDWDQVLRFARHTHLLGHLYYLMDKNALWESVPHKVRDILRGGHVYNRFFRLQARREIRQIAKAVKNVPVILLKGAAYIEARCGAYGGRRLSDIDLLVRQDDLTAVEQTLLASGWQYGEINSYDQHYYRDWMHEVPPMVHKHRNMEVDLHHNIVAPVSRIKVTAQKLFDKAVPIPGTPFLRLENKDLILHSATHLFFNDELRGGLRDLVDMHELCLEFAPQADFWPQLVPRARELGMQRPLYYALSSLSRFLKTPVPDSVMADICKDRPALPVRVLMAGLIQRQLVPDSINKLNAPFTEWLLFVRSHWLRMPLPMLIKHLSYKLFKKQKH